MVNSRVGIGTPLSSNEAPISNAKSSAVDAAKVALVGLEDKGVKADTYDVVEKSANQAVKEAC